MLKQRILSAIVAIAVLASIAFFLPREGIVVTLFLLLAIGSWEWMGFVFRDSIANRAAMSAILILCLVLAWFYLPPDIAIGGALAFWLLAAISLPFQPRPLPTPIVVMAGAFVIVPTLLVLGNLYLGPQGPYWVCFILAIIWSADIGAYFFGKSFGKTKLAPKISPGKTWEGVAGGLLTVAGVSIVASQFLDVPAAKMVPLSVAVAALSIVGDLTVSVFKRNAGVKDSGVVFPGHGGVLDRIDSVTAGAPLCVSLLRTLGIV